MYKVTQQNDGYIIKNPANEKETISWSWVGTSSPVQPRGFMIGTFKCLMAFNTVPDRRRQGFGKMLLNEIIDNERKIKTSYLLLGVEKTNLPAITLYQKAGFVFDGELTPRIHYMYLKL